ncbi:GIY-YIG nuclease family protein [Companilactobacillus sp.]|uniref:GIY-YIG nuclease family protein n=1 Tax=Companilactobacillus sp. TaxID=2767905 RepID=UPI003455D943
MSVVYFIGSDIGPIKVGVSEKPFERLRGLQASSPLRLDILALIGGGLETEYRFHYRYMDFRSHGEWFERCDLILSDINAINDRTFDPKNLKRASFSFKGDSWLAPKHQTLARTEKQRRTMETVWRPIEGNEWDE